ncbi:MAG: hypothetical protein F4145_06250 [Boseongicola sp. SB0675_bin_26]|nr:hypothetical protein [Boseongicola sp. SB0675_bin_26]
MWRLGTSVRDSLLDALPRRKGGSERLGEPGIPDEFVSIADTAPANIRAALADFCGYRSHSPLP